MCVDSRNCWAPLCKPALHGCSPAGSSIDPTFLHPARPCVWTCKSKRQPVRLSAMTSSSTTNLMQPDLVESEWLKISSLATQYEFGEESLTSLSSSSYFSSILYF